MHKLIYISILSLLFFSAAQAQVDTNASNDNYPVEKSDTSLYFHSLNIPVDSIQHWKDLKEFAYAKYLDSLLRARQEKEAKQVSEPSGPGLIDAFLGSSFLRILLWVLGIAFILFVLYRLFLADGVFRRASKTIKQTTPEVEEEVITAESDFNNLINQSIQNGNYRQAVRYQYLKTLHKLADKNWVELAKDKTNFQYVSEIKNPAFQNEFASLTLNYEYVWYGEFAIDKSIYQKIETGFTGLNQKI
jgi:hypothetical protein